MCEERDGLHLVEDDILLEVLDPQTHEPVPDGTPGEMVLTTLTKAARPMIRFRTGDMITADHSPCRCGRTHVRIKVIGRIDDMFIVTGVNVPERRGIRDPQHSGLTGEFRITVFDENHLSGTASKSNAARSTESDAALIERVLHDAKSGSACARRASRSLSPTRCRAARTRPSASSICVARREPGARNRLARPRRPGRRHRRALAWARGGVLRRPAGRGLPLLRPERRGAPVFAYTRVSPAPIGERGVITRADAGRSGRILLDQVATPCVHEDTLVIIDGTPLRLHAQGPWPRVPRRRQCAGARSAGDAYTNTVLLGLLGVTSWLEPAAAEASIAAEFGQTARASKNILAFQRAFALGQANREHAA